MKNTKTLVGTVIAILLIILLANPQWLPLSEATRESVRELEKTFFLIERSGRITLAHILTLLLMIAVLWIVNTAVRAIIRYFG